MTALTKEEQDLQRQTEQAASLNADIRKGDVPDALVVSKLCLQLVDSQVDEKALILEAQQAAKLNADLNHGSTPDSISLTEACTTLQESNKQADKLLKPRKPK